MSNELLKLSDVQRKEFWTSHVKSWKQSGLTQAEYCRKNNLKDMSFSKWKRHFEEKKIGNMSKEFVELKIVQTPVVENEIEIIINDIYKLKLRSGFDEIFLKRVLTVLGNAK